MAWRTRCKILISTQVVVEQPQTSPVEVVPVKAPDAMRLPDQPVPKPRGFGAGTEPGGGLEGGPRGFGTGWSGNLIASGALTGTTSTGDVCGCSTTTCVEIKFLRRVLRPPRHRCDACSMA